MTGLLEHAYTLTLAKAPMTRGHTAQNASATHLEQVASLRLAGVQL